MMRVVLRFLNSAVTAFALLTAPAAMADELEDLFERLKAPELPEWEYVESQIVRVLSDSGSPAMDLLLRRGRAALDADRYDEAIEHFSALIDHAPDFAEAWNARATAFFAAGQIGPALSDVRKTLELEPRHFAAWQGLGILMTEMNRPELALRAFRQAAAIHPHRPDLKEALERLEREVGGQDA